MKYENMIHGETIRTIMNRNKCDPIKFNMMFCDEYMMQNCKMTCEYAIKMSKLEEGVKYE